MNETAASTVLSRFFIGMRPDARRRDALTVAQLRWLGALLLAAQVPQAVHLPAGLALLGLGLTGLRFLLLWRDRAHGGAPLAPIPSWALALLAVPVAFAIYRTYGYLLGREPSVAFLFVLCSIKFLEARVRRDGTLVVCLAAFLLITPFLSSQTMLAAAAALPALLVLGGALDALERTPAGPAQRANWRAPLARTATLIVQGLPIAALLFLMFPRLAGPLWGLPADRSARTGLSDTMTPGMFTELTLSDEVAFRVDFDGLVPPPAERYWRGPVLSRFDGRVWSAGPPQFGGKLAPGTGRTISYTVTLEASEQPRLFALDLPASLPRAGGGADEDGATLPPFFVGLTRDQQLLMRTRVSQPIRYAQRSILRDAYPSTSPQDVRANTRMPPGNPRAAEFARELRRKHPDDAAFIAAVLAHFRTESFVYTLAPPLYEEEPVDQFLFGARRGFCEHFASSFVVLLRAAGIPARVVTGYQGGEMNPQGGYMIVRQSDAHAWAEALIDGTWKRFDPTAAVAPSRVERGLSGALPDAAVLPLLARLDGGWLKDLGLAWDAVNHVWRRHVVDFNHQRQRALWRDLHVDAFMPWQIVGGIAIAVAAWAGLMLLWLARRRRRQERALVLWEDMCRRLARAGLPRAPHEGPLAFTQRAAQRWPQFAIALSAIGGAYATLRYGDLPGAGGERDALTATLQHTINALPPPKALRAAATTG
jgi:transglutaminase-like putative cysteine protease